MFKIIILMMIVLGLEARPLPILKTGQTQSYDADGNIVTDGSIKDDGYYQAGLKLEYARNDATEIVTDNATNLEWQDDANVKDDDANKKNWDDANSYCSTLDLNGEIGWRLPNLAELNSIINLWEYPSPFLSGEFQNFSLSHSWSSTSHAYHPDSAWYVNFRLADSYYYDKSTNKYSVRCVRGEQFDNSSFTRDSVAEIVTDSIEKLQWQDNSEANTTKKSWIESIEYCETLDIGGQTDWRLPNNNELWSLTVKSTRNPAINSQFVNVSSSLNSSTYWSSTTTSGYYDYAWAMGFREGESGESAKSNIKNIRCVRDIELTLKKPVMAPIIAYLLSDTSAPISTELAIKKTGQTKSYNAAGAEITDGTIKDDGHYQTGVTPRYTSASDTVTDEITNLMWQDDEFIQKKWLTQVNYDSCVYDGNLSACNNTIGDTATTYCTDLTLGGYVDWRLPTIIELQSITIANQGSPAMDTSIFTKYASTGYYWSSTTSLYILTAWSIDMQGGDSRTLNKDEDSYVRCVRVDAE